MALNHNDKWDPCGICCHLTLWGLITCLGVHRRKVVINNSKLCQHFIQLAYIGTTFIFFIYIYIFILCSHPITAETVSSTTLSLSLRCSSLSPLRFSSSDIYVELSCFSYSSSRDICVSMVYFFLIPFSPDEMYLWCH